MILGLAALLLQEAAPATRPAAERIVPEAASALGGGDEILARVEETEVRASDLARAMRFDFPAQRRDLLRKLVREELVRREALRLEVFVRREDVDAAVERGLEDLRARVEAESGGRQTLAGFLRNEADTTTEEYRADLERFVVARRFLELVARYDSMSRDRVVLRVIGVPSRKEAEDLLARIREGADFTALARRSSVGPNRAEGGKVPPADRDDPHPAVALAFRLAPGEVGGPVEEKTESGSIWYLARLLESLPARASSFEKIEEEVRASLHEEPLGEREVGRWRERVEARYGVRLSAGRLIGEGEARKKGADPPAEARGGKPRDR